MSDDPACQAPQAPSGAVPRTCVPFAHVPAVPVVPVVAIPAIPVPVPAGIPVLSVSGALPDRTGNVDISQFVAGSVTGKADKAPPSAAGNLASLDASGNLADSGATPASIRAAAVAEVVANAPGTMDTLKEIADILGSTEQTGTVLKRILDLESGKADSSSLAAVATSGSYDDLSNKPTIPAAVSVDATLSATSKNPVQNKVVKGALNGKVDKSGDTMTGGLTVPNLTVGIRASGSAVGSRSVAEGYSATASGDNSHAEGSYTKASDNYSHAEGYRTTASGSSSHAEGYGTTASGSSSHAEGADTTASGSSSHAEGSGNTASGNYSHAEGSRTTAQNQYEHAQGRFNDSHTVANSSFGNPGNTLSSVGFGTADGARRNAVETMQDGKTFVYGVGGYDGTNPTGAGVKDLATAVNDKANASDLPYALVEPGEWEFSGSGYDPDSEYGVTIEYIGEEYGYTYNLLVNGNLRDSILYQESGDLTSVFFYDAEVTATKTGIHLIDRAVNAVSVSTATTLTLPALVNAGKSRDLLVRLTVSADAAVTFSAPSRETATWDEAGSPTATYEAGTHLLRFTEVGLDNGSYIFHFTDLGDGGSIDPAVLNGKLEATSAAPAFDPTKTYSVSEHVTYEGVLYECSTAVTTAGAWTGSTNWTATDMTSPDATLDLMADGRLRLVSADGEVLWMQGYGLASASSVTLSCDKVNFHAFAAAPAFDATAAYAANDIVAYDGVVYVFTAAHAAGAWTGSDATVYAVALAMPTAPSGKVGDFVLDVDNTANASASVTATLTGAGTAFDVFTPEGVNLSTDILTFAGGEQCELYFTMTAFGTAAKPAWKVVKQVVEKQEFGS